MNRATSNQNKQTPSISAIHDMCSIIQQHNMRHAQVNEVSKRKRKAVEKMQLLKEHRETKSLS